MAATILVSTDVFAQGRNSIAAEAVEDCISAFVVKALDDRRTAAQVMASAGADHCANYIVRLTRY